ncbi:MAG: hypothetical protein RL309_1617, partial [Verrucomicrobiota bacterium]
GSARLPDGTIRPELQELIDRGVGVLTADLFLQDDKKLKQTRVVTGPREVPAYTLGYNHALFAQRVHDVITITSYLLTPRDSSQPKVKKVSLAGFGKMGAIAAAARASTGGAIAKAAIDTAGFRFGQLLDYRDPMFLPGGAKYLDVPGLLCVASTQALWVAGEKDASTQALWVAGEKDATLFPSATPHLDGTDAKTAAAVWLGR